MCSLYQSGVLTFFSVVKSRYLGTKACGDFIFPFSQALIICVQTFAEFEMVDKIDLLRNGEFEEGNNPQIPETLLTPFIEAVNSMAALRDHWSSVR